MGTLRAPPPCKTFLNSPETTPKSCVASFLKQRKARIGHLALRKSLAEGNKNNAGVRSSQDGSSIIEGEKIADGLLLGTERDAVSGSVVGFHLTPPPGISIPLSWYSFVNCNRFVFY